MTERNPSQYNIGNCTVHLLSAYRWPAGQHPPSVKPTFIFINTKGSHRILSRASCIQFTPYLRHIYVSFSHPRTDLPTPPPNLLKSNADIRKGNNKNKLLPVTRALYASVTRHYPSEECSAPTHSLQGARRNGVFIFGTYDMPKRIGNLTSDVYTFWGAQSWLYKLIIYIVCFEIEYILVSQFKNVDVMATQASSSGIY